MNASHQRPGFCSHTSTPAFPPTVQLPTTVQTNPRPAGFRPASRLFAVDQPVSHAPHSDEVAGTKFVAQVADIDINHIGTGVEVVAPDP